MLKLFKMLSGAIAAIFSRRLRHSASRKRRRVAPGWTVRLGTDPCRWTVWIAMPGAPEFEVDARCAAEIASFMANPPYVRSLFFQPEGREPWASQATMWKAGDKIAVCAGTMVSLPLHDARRLAAELLWALDTVVPPQCALVV